MNLDHRGEAEAFRRQLESIPSGLTAPQAVAIAAFGLFISAAVECVRFYW